MNATSHNHETIDACRLADAAQAMSRWHWKKADRLAAAFHNHQARRPNV